MLVAAIRITSARFKGDDKEKKKWAAHAGVRIERRRRSRGVDGGRSAMTTHEARKAEGSGASERSSESPGPSLEPWDNLNVQSAIILLQKGDRQPTHPSEAYEAIRGL